MTTSYAWLITTDHISKGEDKGRTGSDGTRGRANRRALVLDPSIGRPFRLRDDDGELYYSGVILVTDEAGVPESGTQDDFAPLDDFGEPNAGCTSIEYLTVDVWERL